MIAYADPFGCLWHTPGRVSRRAKPVARGVRRTCPNGGWGPSSCKHETPPAVGGGSKQCAHVSARILLHEGDDPVGIETAGHRSKG